MRALVIGASGQVGAALMDALLTRGHEARGTYANHPAPGLDALDLSDHAAVARAIAAARPDWVFCPAGLSHVDYCEDHADEAMSANRDGRMLAQDSSTTRATTSSTASTGPSARTTRPILYASTDKASTKASRPCRLRAAGP
jgi:dTDP-4-dehydrorhamnose reductase